MFFFVCFLYVKCFLLHKERVFVENGGRSCCAANVDLKWYCFVLPIIYSPKLPVWLHSDHPKNNRKLSCIVFGEKHCCLHSVFKSSLIIHNKSYSILSNIAVAGGPLGLCILWVSCAYLLSYKWERSMRKMKTFKFRATILNISRLNILCDRGASSMQCLVLS